MTSPEDPFTGNPVRLLAEERYEERYAAAPGDKVEVVYTPEPRLPWIEELGLEVIILPYMDPGAVIVGTLPAGRFWRIRGYRRATRPQLPASLCVHDRLADEWITSDEFRRRFIDPFFAACAQPDVVGMTVKYGMYLPVLDPASIVRITGV